MRKIIAILISTSCVGCASTEKYIDNFITLNNNNRQNILHEKENHYNSLLQKLKKK